MDQEPRTFEARIVKEVHLDYLLALPKGYADSSKPPWPLLLFLHGLGERGNDLDLLKKHGIPQLLHQGADLPMIVVSPQCPERSDWTLHTDDLDALLEHVSSQFNVDRRRIYLTGLSMGGKGAWLMAALFPQRFAALVPICGKRPDCLRRSENAFLIKDIPTWVFHGEKDPVVPVEESKLIVETLRAAGGKPRLTLYPDAGHDAWSETYANPALFEWMLSQKLPYKT